MARLLLSGGDIARPLGRPTWSPSVEDLESEWRVRSIVSCVHSSRSPTSVPSLFAVWSCMPSRYTSSADTHAMVVRIAPSILELLGDGIPRSRRALFAALADRWPKEEVELTLMRLAVTDHIRAASCKYTLAPTTEPEQG